VIFPDQCKFKVTHSPLSKELDLHSPAALESQYLRLKVETLTNAIRLLPMEEAATQQRPSHPSRSASGTHYCPTGDPAEQTKDAIMETVQILRTLRTRESSVPVTQIAADLEDLSMQLLDLGMYEDARQTYLQVVRIYRGSTAEENRPAIIDARVARALIGVSTSLHHLGKSQEGLEPIREAWSIFRHLEDAHPAGFRHELALTLNNMANHLRDSSLHNEAINSANEAVKLRRQLAIELPDVHKADLVASLLNASTCYSKMSRMDHQALITVAEAVSLSRKLVATQPEVFEPYLGASLHNSANRYSALHDDASAYRDIQEAVMIRRKLAMARPSVFVNGLTRSLAVATMLALKCKDVGGAALFNEERQRVHKSGSVVHYPTVLAEPCPLILDPHPCKLTIPNTRALSSAYTPHTSLCQVLSPRFWKLQHLFNTSCLANGTPTPAATGPVTNDIPTMGKPTVPNTQTLYYPFTSPTPLNHVTSSEMLSHITRPVRQR
jgi:tetratricopeptide (TPR) repeat protein